MTIAHEFELFVSSLPRDKEGRVLKSSQEDQREWMNKVVRLDYAGGRLWADGNLAPSFTVTFEDGSRAKVGNSREQWFPLHAYEIGRE